MLLRQHCEIGDGLDEHLLLTFIMERSGQMVMIDHIGPALRTEHDGHHVLAEIFGFVPSELIPALSSCLDLDHPDRDLSRPKRFDRNRRKKWIPIVSQGSYSSRVVSALRIFCALKPRFTPPKVKPRRWASIEADPVSVFNAARPGTLPSSGRAAN